LWDGPKDDRKSVKLKVEFAYADNISQQQGDASQTHGGHSRQGPSVSENVESVRNRLNVSEGGNRGAEDTPNAISASATPEAIFSELQSLRKKYDAVVEYTVHLTAERDAIVSQLEVSQRELSKEKSKRKGEAGGSGGGAGGKNEKGADKKVVEKGFSLFVVLFAALICFLIGKYIS